MKVLIDADGCPVVDIAADLCRSYHVPCWICCDTAHEFSRTDVEIFVFDKGADSVDFAITGQICPGDIVITQDYGLASMCLARRARVIHQDGWEYTTDNIDALLLARHEARKHRAAGGRIKGPKKRSTQQNQSFASALTHLLQTAVQG